MEIDFELWALEGATPGDAKPDPKLPEDVRLYFPPKGARVKTVRGITEGGKECLKFVCIGELWGEELKGHLQKLEFFATDDPKIVRAEDSNGLFSPSGDWTMISFEENLLYKRSDKDFKVKGTTVWINPSDASAGEEILEWIWIQQP